MSGWTAALLGLVLVVNPAGVSRAAAWEAREDARWRPTVARAVAAATAVLLAAGLVTGPLLAAIDVSTPTFRLATAVVVGLTGAKWLLAPTPPIESVDATSPEATLALTLLLTPGPVFAAMAANGDAGWLAGVVSVVVAMALTATALLARRLPDTTSVWLARLVGALAVVAAVAIGLDSARSV